MTPTVLQLPLSGLYFSAGFIPDDLELNEAGIVLVPSGFVDAGEPFVAVRTYSAVDDPDPDRQRLEEIWVQIDVVDAFTLTEQRYCTDEDGQPRDAEECRAEIPESACDGTEAIAAGTVDPEVCIAEEIENAEPIYSQDATVMFTETEVRGRPALLRTETAADYSDTMIVVYEGNEIITRVGGHQIDRDDVLRIAAELRSITRTEFEADLSPGQTQP